MAGRKKVCQEKSDESVAQAATANPRHHVTSENVLSPLESVTRSSDHDPGERPCPGRVVLERLDQLRRPPVEIFVASADDDRDRHANAAKRAPASVRTVIREHVLAPARPVEAQVTPRAPEAEGARHEPPGIAARDALGHLHAAPELAD